MDKLHSHQSLPPISVPFMEDSSNMKGRYTQVYYGNPSERVQIHSQNYDDNSPTAVDSQGTTYLGTHDRYSHSSQTSTYHVYERPIHPLQSTLEPYLPFTSIPTEATIATAHSSFLPLSSTPSGLVSSSSPSSPLPPSFSFGEKWQPASLLVSAPTIQPLPSIPGIRVSNQFMASSAPDNEGRGRKKLFVSKIRRVFNKSATIPSAKEGFPETKSAPSLSNHTKSDMTNRQQSRLEDIISLSSVRQDGGLLPFDSELVQHRGSVSSLSSGGTAMSVGHAEFGLNTPLTSPDVSPSGSPKLKPHAVATIAPYGEQQQLPQRLSRSHLQFDLEDLVLNLAIGYAEDQYPGSNVTTQTLHPSTVSVTGATDLPTTSTRPESAECLGLEPSPSRRIKKRLSLASITSFFSSRGSDTTETSSESRKKQRPPKRRSSYAATSENPLITVGRQITGYRRRHSLNDLSDIPVSKLNEQRVSSWKRDHTAQTNSTVTSSDIEPLSVESKNCSSKIDTKVVMPTTTAEPTKMSKIYGAFGKQTKGKGKIPSTMNTPMVTVASENKSFRSALVRHRQHASSLKKQQQLQPQYQQPSLPVLGVCELPSASGIPAISLSPNASPISQPTSEGHGPSISERATRPEGHRHQRSFAGRQARQQGQCSSLDRKQRNSIKHSSEIKHESIYYADPLALEAQQPLERFAPLYQNQSGAYINQRYHHQHHGYPQQDSAGYEPVTLPLKPKVAPISTAAVSSVQERRQKAQHHDTYLHPYEASSRQDSASSKIGIQTLSRYRLSSTAPYVQGNAGTAVSYSSSQTSHGSPDISTNHRHQPYQLQQQYHGAQHQQQQPYMDHLQLQQQQQHQHRLLQQRQQQQQQQFMNALASTSCSCTHQGAMSYTHYPSHSTHYISKQQCDSQHQYRHQEHHRQSPRSFCHLNQHTLNTNKNNKLSSFNPKPVRKLCFSTAQPSIHFTWPSDQYDRTSDPNTTAHRLSPSLAQKIKIEMNQFKSQEMMVHPDSHVNTHIFV